MSDSGAVRVDEEDLESSVWSCHKYRLLQNGRNLHCRQVIDTSTRFRVHIRRFHENERFPKLFMCPIKNCNEYDKLFARLQHLQNHYDCMHRVSQEYSCPVCKVCFSSGKTWKRHVRDCSAGFLKCDYCQRTFSGHSSLSRHCRTSHLSEIQKKIDKAFDDSSTTSNHVKEAPADKPHNARPYVVVPVIPASKDAEVYYGEHYTTQYPSKRAKRSELGELCHIAPAKQDSWTACSSQAPAKQDSWTACSSQAKDSWTSPPSYSSWDKGAAWAGDTRPDWEAPQGPVPPTSSTQDCWQYDEDLLQDKQLYSALDNITTQTDEFWGFNELSTQTVTEHNSFGTQTACGEDVLGSFLADYQPELQELDIVEYLDGAVQTDSARPQVDSTSFGSQTSISSERFRNERSCGVERSDRDCQTILHKNSTTQTKLMRERAVIVADGLNSETQTTELQHQYNETQTQT